MKNIRLLWSHSVIKRYSYVWHKYHLCITYCEAENKQISVHNVTSLCGTALKGWTRKGGCHPLQMYTWLVLLTVAGDSSLNWPQYCSNCSIHIWISLIPIDKRPRKELARRLEYPFISCISQRRKKWIDLGKKIEKRDVDRYLKFNVQCGKVGHKTFNHSRMICLVFLLHVL